jgi:hypothetical protein
MKKLLVSILVLCSAKSFSQVDSTVDFKARKFVGKYTIKESCELGDKGTSVIIRMFHNHIQGEACASYLNVEAYGSKLNGVDIPAASGWAFNEGSFYKDFAHYQLNHADWITIGSIERLVAEQRLHLYETKRLVKNHFKIETDGKNTVKIESRATNNFGTETVNCFLTRKKD